MDRTMISRVRALLAKAESTEFREEAEALSAKAHELMARHAIDQILLDAGSPDDQPQSRRVHVDSPYAAPKSLLLAEVADANRCRVVWNRHFQVATIFGFEADLDATELLYTSLLLQATRAMLSAHPAPGGRIRAFRRSFLMAYGERVGERLDEVSREAVDDADDDSLLPVLASRAAAVDEAVSEAFPHLGRMTVSHSSPSGSHAGRQAADRADLQRNGLGRVTRSIGRS